VYVKYIHNYINLPYILPFAIKTSTIECHFTLHTEKFYYSEAFQLTNWQFLNFGVFQLTYRRNIHYRGITYYAMKKSEIAWHCTFLTEKIYYYFILHLKQWRNTIAWHSIINTEIFIISWPSIYALKNLKCGWHSRFHIEELCTFLALQCTQCRFLQLRGISNYTTNKSAFDWHSIISPA
jgi:hypothetical protein